MSKPQPLIHPLTIIQANMCVLLAGGFFKDNNF